MRPRQVQDFIPTPMAIATAMYYTGLDPLTGKPVHVARDLREKRMMKALLFYWDAQHAARARGADQGGPRDLIGKLVPAGDGHDRHRSIGGRSGPPRAKARGWRRPS